MCLYKVVIYIDFLWIVYFKLKVLFFKLYVCINFRYVCYVLGYLVVFMVKIYFLNLDLFIIKV